ncbi:leucine-rich repeat domain-containing protein, partial [Treponema phagedenis]|uniref:leucine-rich repeat domain-containing protein n=1 Tax=Treponema phagedenis TaxID=162 RepID=UPI001C07DC55
MDGSPCTVLHGDAILSEVPGTGTPQTISGIDSDKEIVIKGKGIQILHCNDNKLNALELNAVPNLTELYCQDNQLTSLNVSGLDNLITLYCYGNKRPSLSVKGLNKLTTLYCY